MSKSKGLLAGYCAGKSKPWNFWEVVFSGSRHVSWNDAESLTAVLLLGTMQWLFTGFHRLHHWCSSNVEEEPVHVFALLQNQSPWIFRLEPHPCPIYIDSMTSCTTIATDYQSTALSGNVTDFNWNERERRHIHESNFTKTTTPQQKT